MKVKKIMIIINKFKTLIGNFNIILLIFGFKMKNSRYKDINICLINLYFGTGPDWFPYFLQSCKANSGIEFIIFSDSLKSNIKFKNIRFYNFSITDFNLLASKKLGFEIEITNPYKICDLKPAFGIIFKEYLKNFDFWGYCDNDIIFGDIRLFITNEILKKYDVISSYKGFMSGPFCLFRNINYTLEIFKDILNYKRTFQSIKHYAIDENVIKASLKVLGLIKILYGIAFIINEIVKGNFSFKRIKQIKYQFQWYYKRKMLKENEPVDMTEAVWKAEKLGKIKSLFNEVLLSDLYFTRIKYLNWEFEWKGGKLLDKKLNTELLGLHFIESKLKNDFYIEDYKNTDSFLISKNGIYSK